MKRFILAMCLIALLPLLINLDSNQRIKSEKAAFVLESKIQS